AGATWSDVTTGLPDRSITSVAVDPADPATAFVTLSGFGSSHVFSTTDSGATWRDRGDGLPDVPVNTLLIDPVVPDTLYVGNAIGVFRSTNRGQHWDVFSRGLPPVIVNQFAAQSSGILQVATYGRGIFQTIGNQRPIIESATYDGKKHVSISGRGFGDAPMVLINSHDLTGKIVSLSGTEIVIKAKPKKLALVPGDNTVQVISNGMVSEVFRLRLETILFFTWIMVSERVGVGPAISFQPSWVSRKDFAVVA